MSLALADAIPCVRYVFLRVFECVKSGDFKEENSCISHVFMLRPDRVIFI